MIEFLKEIKWAYQRVVKGYDDRIMWEFDSYFEQFIPAIEKFCKIELGSEEIEFNPKRKKIFKDTLKIINDINTTRSCIKREEMLSNLWKYFGANIGYYWN